MDAITLSSPSKPGSSIVSTGDENMTDGTEKQIVSVSVFAKTSSVLRSHFSLNAFGYNYNFVNMKRN